MGAGSSSSLAATATATSVLTVHSISPVKDARLLQEIFPNEFTVECVVDNSESTSSATATRILLSSDKSLTVLLVASDKPLCATWVVDSDAALEAANQLQDEQQAAVIVVSTLQGFCVVEILLAGGSSILMLSPELLASADGRQALAAKLAQFGETVSRNEQDDEFLDVALHGSDDGDNDDGNNNDIDTLDTPITTTDLFPSLRVGCLGENGVIQDDFRLNSKVPIDIETELFKGQMLFIVRPPNPEDDPYWNERIFSKRKRRMVIQFQGKFKYQPRGIVYAGAEVSDQMKLGMLVRGLAGMLLKLVESCTSNVHYSFGDSKGLEKPHIVGPAYTFFERVLSTPPGETLPPLDELFEESSESISRRKTSKSNGDWNTTDTYSFSFYSMYIDLPTWKLVSLPVSGDISLKTFWGKSLLSICMYEKLGDDKRHLQEFNRYAVSVQSKFLGLGTLPKGGFDRRVDDDDLMRWSAKRTLPVGGLDDSENDDGGGMFRSESQLFPAVMMVEDSDDEFFFDAEDTLDDEVSVANVVSSMAVDLLSAIDTVCPAWIEVCASRGTYYKTYVFTTGNETSFRTSQACKDLIHESPFAQVVDENFSPRMASSERARRVLGLVLVNEAETGKVKAFKANTNHMAGLFLRRPPPLMSEKEKSIVQKCGYVARAISDRHWAEEWVKMTSRCISFYHPDKRKSQFRIPVASIVGVHRLARELTPNFPRHHFLVVETLGRSVYLMFASDTERDSWLDLIPQLKDSAGGGGDGDSVSSNESSRSARAMEINNPADDFMHKPSMWDFKHRRILNCRQFSFRCQSNDGALRLAESALVRALEVSGESFDDSDRLAAFLDSTAALKQADVHSLPEDARLTFFLNVYHVMILHAFLVLGPPDSTLKWLSYFNNIAYQVSDDIFSLTELEHCIIRAKMSYPSQFLSRFVLPKSQYHIAVTKVDFRINFALNCGSVSNPSTVPIYRVDQLDRQLDAASKLYLRCVTTTRRSARDVYIQIPRVCQWFSEDFGSQEEQITKIAPFFSSEAREALASCWLSQQRRFDMSCLTIRYLPFIFECRPLSLETSI